MIERSGDLPTRISRWIKEKRGDGGSLYELISPPNRVVVREMNERGEAHIEISYPDSSHCIAWYLEKTGYFQFLEGDKAADGVFFVCHTDSRIDVHIIECKRTITNSTWAQAKKQLQESLTKVLAIAGVLGIEIDNVCLGAAFRDNRLDSAQYPEPRTGVDLLGEATLDSEMTARAGELKEWRTGQVKLRGFAKPFPLVKIQLDTSTGRGTYALPNP